MSTATEVTRIQTARNAIRTKFAELGLVQPTAKIDALAVAAEGIENRGAVNAQVQEGDTYTIPRGYHNGSGVVSGVAGGGSYNLQEKSVTPTKNQQNITPDSGYYGLSGVTVAAIPSNYNDTSSVTAGAADVLANKIVVSADGESIAGTMPNNGSVTKTLDTTTTSYTIAKGYHTGTGKVSISLETKAVTPSKSNQTIKPTSGKVLSQVVIEAIPSDYIMTNDANATAANILNDKIAYVKGEKITGSMPNNGDVSATMDGLTLSSVTIPAGYTSGGTVSLTSDIEEALAAI